MTKKGSIARLGITEIKKRLQNIKSPGEKFNYIRWVLEKNGQEIPEEIRRQVYSIGATILDSECGRYASQDKLRSDFNFIDVPDARKIAAEYWEKAGSPRKAAEDYLLTWDKADKAVQLFVALGDLEKAKQACVVAGSSTPVKKFLLGQGHTKEAAEAFESLAKDRPMQGEYAVMAADLWFQLGDNRRAIQNYDLASKSFYRSSSNALGDKYNFKAKTLREKDSGLEKATATASIVGILGGLFFLSSNITGNAIANVSQNSSNVLGAVLLGVGLVAGFFWVKNHK